MDAQAVHERDGERAAGAPRAAPCPPLALGAFLLLTAVALARGGYFPATWGWCVLVLCLIAAPAILGSRLAVGRLGLLTLAALALLTGWTALSIAWSEDVPQSVLELQRTLVYLTAAIAAVATVRGRSAPQLLGGALASVTAVCAYAVGTRLLWAGGAGPEPIALNRLADPIGYWNALGIFAAIGLLIGLGFAAHGRRPTVRAAAAASSPLLLATIYFTYSRGAWLALIGGLVVAVALDPRRLRLIATSLLLAPGAVAGVLLCAGSEGPTRLQAPHEVLVREQGRLALFLVLLALASAAVALVPAWGERRFPMGRGARAAFAGVLLLTLAVGLAGAFSRFGSPVSLAEGAYRSFKNEQPAAAPPPRSHADPRARLFTLQSNGRIDSWSLAWRQHERHPWRGSGAGTFEQHWLRERPYATHIRDAHGLFVEVLAELGWTGLGLAVAAFLLPLVAAIRSRGHVLAPATAGAYVAFLLHAQGEWDWEMPVVVLLALACAVALLAMDGDAPRRRRSVPLGARLAVVAALVGVSAFSAAGTVGNQAAATATAAANRADWSEAVHRSAAARAWAPWSPLGWQALGRAQLGLGRRRVARESLLEAKRRDPGDWRVWYDLATASRGVARWRAYARAADLNPLAQDIEVLRRDGLRLPRGKPGRLKR